MGVAASKVNFFRPMHLGPVNSDEFMVRARYYSYK